MLARIAKTNRLETGRFIQWLKHFADSPMSAVLEAFPCATGLFRRYHIGGAAVADSTD